ncbi:MAG: DUF1893 domain-containing protein [Tissierellaceae bacterium]|nr:DUF1893 domain-containing protein [Tissierellaceae bacterium]
MNDIDIAKKILVEENLGIVVVKEGKEIFRSTDRGIGPMYTLATEMREESYKSSIADKIIGRGAALLCGYLGIEELYGKLISESGISALEHYNIPYFMDNSCPYIMNREKTDHCPIEKLSQDVEEPEILIEKIGKFLSSINSK